VTEALLVTRGSGSAWRLTFTPEPIQEGASTPADGRLTVELAPSLVDNMFFDVSYSREEITALAEGSWTG
jgi:hypothetical protein